MKVRIKFVSNPSDVVRVEVQATGTLRDLQAAVQAAAGPHIPADVQISLNKKTPVSTNDADSLVSLGICNGDLLWVLSSNAPAAVNAQAAGALAAPPPTTPMPPAAGLNPQQAEAPGSKKARQATGPELAVMQASAAAPAAAAGGTQAMDIDPPASTNQGAASATHSAAAAATAAAEGRMVAGTSSDAGGVMGSEGAEGMEEVDEEAGPSTVECPAPSILKRLLAALHVPAPKSAAPVNPHPAAGNNRANGAGKPQGASGAEPPIQLPATYSGPPAHQLLLLVLHAAMTEAGFQLSHQEPNAEGDAGAAPASGSSSNVGSPPAVPAVPRLPLTGPARLTYTWASADGAQLPACTVQAVRMGRFLVLHASVATPAPGSTDSTAAVPAVRTLHLDAVQEVDLEVAAAGGGKLSVGVFGSFKSLWLKLRDGIAQWAVAVCHEAAGLEVPLGLMTLPIEIKLLILAALPARDLAAVSSTCTELHHLAYEDRLWSVHLEKEFPGAAAAVRGPQGSMRALFVSKWMARKRAEEARARRRHLMPGLLPRPIPMPGGPPIPGMSSMPPNIIGGDYDLFPNLGAFGGMGALGGMGGMLGGGAGFSGPGFLPGRAGAGLMAPRHGGINGRFGGPLGRRGGGSSGGGGMFG